MANSSAAESAVVRLIFAVERGAIEVLGADRRAGVVFARLMDGSGMAGSLSMMASSLPFFFAQKHPARKQSRSQTEITIAAINQPLIPGGSSAPTRVPKWRVGNGRVPLKQ